MMEAVSSFETSVNFCQTTKCSLFDRTAGREHPGVLCSGSHSLTAVVENGSSFLPVVVYSDTRCRKDYPTECAHEMCPFYCDTAREPRARRMNLDAFW
jgi:hypothetical protein